MGEFSLSILDFLQNAALFACPLVAYVLLFKGRKRHRTQQGHYSIPDWNFFLKKWWVYWKLWRLRSHHQSVMVTSTTAFMATQDDEDKEALRTIVKYKEMDSMTISGTDHKGNAIHLKISRKMHNTTEVWLHILLEDGSLYQLPDHPDTVLRSNNSTSWVGGGLKIQMCEPMRRWRITFNGLLRQGTWDTRKMENNNDKMEHIRFCFIWTACSDVVDVQKEWNTTLMCDSLARERWRNGKWIKMRKQIGKGYDQWGTLQGTWTRVDDCNTMKELYLRGLRRRRYGTDEGMWQRRSVNYIGVATDGSMFSIEARCSELPGLTHAVFGHVYQPNGCQASVHSCDLSLPNLGEHPECIPQHAVLRFSAGSKNYTASVHTIPHSVATFYGGRPWNYEARAFVFRCILNAKQGAGTAVFWYRYCGQCPTFPPISLPILKEPQFKPETFVPLVVDFKDRQCGSSVLVGGKGSSLGLMASLRKNKLSAVIPPGFCLTVASLEMQLQENSELEEAVATLAYVNSTSSNFGDIQEQCSRTVAMFESTPVCETVSAEVSVHLQHLLDSCSKPHLFAVRSSAVGEDSEDLSAAGQNATLLGVRGELADILEAIQNCWASLFTFQSLQYRRQHGQPVQVGMGVVVQLMVPADSAGVLFTWHPTNGDPRCMLITANFGLGESVVSAQVEPDTILLARNRKGQVILKESRTGNKAHRISISEEGGITAEPMEDEKINQLCLTEEEALSLGHLGLQLEQMFGGPRDIEWAISQGHIYLLQSRPITSLDSWSDFELLHEFDAPIITDTEMLTTANVGEVFPGVITPLSQSITARSTDLAPRHGLPYRPGYQYSANVVTSNYHAMINVFNTMLRSVGSEISLGDKVVDLAVYGHVVTTAELLRLAIERNGSLGSLGRLCLVLKIVKDMLLKGRVVQRAEKVTREFSLAYNNYNHTNPLYSCITNSLKSLAEVAECHGDTSRIGLFTQVVAITVLTEGSEELTPDHYSDVALLLSSCTDVISAEIPAALEDLALSITSTGKASEFCKVMPLQAVYWLQKNCPDVATKLHSFLDKHGHRCIKEFELMTETWGMKPEELMRTLQVMLKNSTMRRSQKNIKRNITDKEIISELKSVKKHGTRKVLGWLLSLCRSSVIGRETNKNCYITIVHKLRLAYRHLAQLMVKEGYIPDPQLVFFFTHYELGMFLQTRNPALITKAMRRRRLIPQWEQLKFPEIIRGVPTSIHTESQNASNKSKALGVRLKGTSVCFGTVMGQACVITNLDQIGKLKSGDILITHSTDVGWSPYFPLLGGVVTELGGLISHGAVVAREYGLPCIVGCQGATTAFTTGDTVLLVGAMGTLEKIDVHEE